MKKRRMMITFAVMATLLAVGCTDESPRGTTGQAVESAGSQTGDYYTCPMHPSVRSDRPGACPVCGMALVKKSAGADPAGVDLAGFHGVTLSPTQRVLANVTTIPVERRRLTKNITAVGMIDYAEPRYTHISMRFPGRLEKLYLGYTGMSVRKGDPVAEVYSPEAVSAQQEYLIALNWYEQVKRSGSDAVHSAKVMVEQARQKLLLWDFTEQQIAELESTRELKYFVTIYSPMSGTVMKKNVHPQHYAMTGEDIYDIADLSVVWVYLDVYEKDIGRVAVGLAAEIMAEAYPGEKFSGKVTFIDPVVQPETRTVRVRTEFANPAGKLKPSMYVKATITMPVMSALSVPASAVLSTGKRNVVWVEVQENAFESRDVVLGMTTGAFTEILSGLLPGERVAETGGYLIDSEAALQSPTGTDPHAGHGVQSAAGNGRAGRMEEHAAATPDAQNAIDILVKGRYSPDVIRVKQGTPVKLKFYRDEDADCTNEVMFEGLNLRRRLPARQTTVIEITPRDTGEIAFTCGMGMIRGKLIVTK